jgi:acetyl esterase/lipase
LHGGGYETGSPGTVRHLAGILAQEACAECLTIDYRLAPEHPCPAAVEDAVTAFLGTRNEIVFVAASQTHVVLRAIDRIERSANGEDCKIKLLFRL